MDMTEFPAFLRHPANAVAVDPNHASAGLEGFVFDGANGSQIVLWQCPKGGTSPEHVHDFDEYAIVAQGTFRGSAGGAKVSLGPGEECYIPAGVPHEGSYSVGYRAIDGFGGQRVKRAGGRR